MRTHHDHLRPRFVLSLSLSLSLSLCLTACEDDDDDKDDDNDTPSAWLVGDNGAMHRIEAQGDLASYPLQSQADLTDIACLGSATAWVSGEAGTILRTRDAGETWTIVDAATTADLTSIATVEATPEGAESVWVVGERGFAALTTDGGARWTTLDAGAVDFTGVATGHHGAIALATSDDGTIWRLAPDGAQRLLEAPLPLHAIAMTPDGGTAVAVGDAGAIWRSSDGARTWVPLATEVEDDLYAVAVASSGDYVVAVGDAGRVVVVDEGAITRQRLPNATGALRGLHLRSDGEGQAVGDSGMIWRTFDDGATWTRLRADTHADLTGVDDFHLGAHL